MNKYGRRRAKNFLVHSFSAGFHIEMGPALVMEPLHLAGSLAGIYFRGMNLTSYSMGMLSSGVSASIDCESDISFWGLT